MVRIRGKSLAIVGAVAAVGVLGAGFAVAATSTPTIKACAKKSDGALRLAKTCKSTEKSVKWGAAGPTGPRGGVGPAGPSDTYLFSVAPTAASMLHSGSDVATFTLPAGNWLLRSNVRVSVTSAAESSVFCTFNINSSVKGTTFWTAVPKIGADVTSAVLPVEGTVRLTQATPLHLFCRNNDAQAGVTKSSIVATRVGTLTPAPAPQTFFAPA